MSPSLFICHHRYLFVTIAIYLSPSLFICHHRYLFVTIVIYLSPSLFICHHRYLFVTIVIYLSPSLFICHHRYLFVTFVIYLSPSLFICHHRYLFVTIAIYLSPSLFICHHRYLFVTIAIRPQVRTFYRSCRKKASCNCAVAVRSGDDVIVIDRCAAQDSEPDTQMVIRTYITGELTPGTRIVRYVGGREYRVSTKLTSIV